LISPINILNNKEDRKRKYENTTNRLSLLTKEKELKINNTKTYILNVKGPN